MMMFTNVRVVCANTVRAAIQGADVQARVWHTGNVEWQFKNAMEVIGVVRRTFERQAEAYRVMAAKQVTRNEVIEYFNRLIPDAGEDRRNTRAKNVRAGMMYLYENARGQQLPGVRGTVWGAYNAVTEWITQCRLAGSSQDRRLNSEWFGSGAKLNDRAFDEAMSMLN